MADQGLPAALGRYVPTSVLGRGAMGAVFRAHDPLIDRTVAIKVIRADLLDAEAAAEFLDRFRREVRAAGRCAHPGIVAVYDFGETADGPFIVMELVDGRTLQQILRDPQLRATLDPVALILEILDALAYAHGQQIVHRDIKPANVMVTAEGRAKIADFGVARMSSTATLSGGLVGTPSYMAPEQVTGAAVDHRADLFATAAVLYEMATGKPPFLGRDMNETIFRLTNNEPVALAPLAQGAFAAYVPVLRRALEKAPERRFPSARDFAAALRGAQAGGAGDATVVARPASPGAAQPKSRLDTAFLKSMESLLGRFLGPVARVLVAKAATGTDDPEELCRSLAQSITREADQAEFLRQAAGQLGRSLSGASLGATKMAPAATPLPTGAVPAAALPEIEAALTAHVGPIARVLIKRAGAQSASATEFCDRLASGIPRPEDAAQFRRDLAQILARQR
jgi:eukaryotic-like serine/threonine-protein kinase